MLIVVEGPDAAGKSSLVRFLQAAWANRDPADGHLMSRVVHKGPPTSPNLCPFTEYEVALDTEPLASQVRSRDTLVIADRWHAGEAIYGPLRRGHSRLTNAGMTHVELSLAALGALRVVCLPSRGELELRLRRRRDAVTTPRELDALHAGYDAHAARYGYVRFVEEEPEVAAAELIRHAIFLHGAASMGADFGTTRYLGSPVPVAVLCGDVRNDGPHANPDLTRPFTPLRQNDSSSWLLSALYLADVVNEVGVLNTGEPGVDLDASWRSLGRPRLVALGHEAAKRLAALDLPHVRVPHPQWSRRFRFSHLGDYALQLKGAVRGA